MSKEHQEHLLKFHIEDLKGFLPGAKEVFVCPICLNVFSFDCIEDNLVDVGHVWPKYFRERSEQAKHQQVLLCKKCNSSAGRAGDEIIQEDAQIDAAANIFCCFE
jgi:5-methylcytosine-specific restriction endonuclease McrA